MVLMRRVAAGAGSSASALKKQWIEFLGEKPDPATNRTEETQVGRPLAPMPLGNSLTSFQGQIRTLHDRTRVDRGRGG
jgi:hypothetical protein